MEVEVIHTTVSRQNFLLPEGSVIQEVKELKCSYKGLWCSMYGTFTVTVNKKDCKVI